MAAFELPAPAKEVFRNVAAMPDGQYARLASFVSSLPQDRLLTVTVDRLQRKLSPEDRRVFWPILSELSRLARTVENKRGGTQTEVIRQAVEQTDADEASAVRLTERLEGLLAGKALQLHARAWSLLYEEERATVGLRLVTDIRPIFNDAGDVADNFIIVNHLHVRYQEDQQLRNIFFALDDEDIETLSSLADRAKRKMDFLKRLIIVERVAAPWCT
jgi:hypothetical protein